MICYNNFYGLLFSRYFHICAIFLTCQSRQVENIDYKYKCVPHYVLHVYSRFAYVFIHYKILTCLGRLYIYIYIYIYIIRYLQDYSNINWFLSIILIPCAKEICFRIKKSDIVLHVNIRCITDIVRFDLSRVLKENSSCI